jgi:hypothetical protein
MHDLRMPLEAGMRDFRTPLEAGMRDLRTPLEAGMQDLWNEAGTTTWNMPNDFTEAVINAVNTQGLLGHNNPVSRSV